jgi:hypothetical protein
MKLYQQDGIAEIEKEIELLTKAGEAAQEQAVIDANNNKTRLVIENLINEKNNLQMDIDEEEHKVWDIGFFEVVLTFYIILSS